jgi:hypothetical protein
MSTPTFGLSREYVAATTSFTPSSGRCWIATHINRSGNKYQGYEQGIADKVPFP